MQNRWLLVEFLPVLNDDRVSIAAPTTLDGRKVYNALKHSIVCNFGDTGWGAVGLSMSGAYATCPCVRERERLMLILMCCQSSISRQ